MIAYTWLLWYQLTGQGVLDKACEDNQLCVVSILPHILDCQSECRNNYLDILRQMGEKYKKRQWGYVYSLSLLLKKYLSLG